MRHVLRICNSNRFKNFKRFDSYGVGRYSGGTARTNKILNIVPQQEAWIVERFGKFHKLLNPGLQILIPIVDVIKYVHSLKEIAVNIAEQTAITKDNVTLTIDGVLFYQVIDPYKASYQIENHDYAIKQLAQTTMRSEIGKLILDDVFKERDALNLKIVESIQNACKKWGIECMRYEIRNVSPPQRILDAMQLQVEAERNKRAAILESEGLKEAAINKATGEAQAIKINAESRAIAIKLVADAMSQQNSNNAVSYSIAQQYIQAFEKLAKETNTVILPKNVNNIGSAIAEALGIYHTMQNSNNAKSAKNQKETNKSPNIELKAIQNSKSEPRPNNNEVKEYIENDDFSQSWSSRMIFP